MDSIVDVQSTGEAHDYDDIEVTDDVGGVVVLEANPERKSALIINVGEGEIRVTTDGSEPNASHGKHIGPGGSLSLSPPYCPTKEVRAFCHNGGSTFVNASEVD